VVAARIVGVLVMGRSSGLFLILAGVAIAAYGMPSVGGTSEPVIEKAARKLPAFPPWPVRGTEMAPNLPDPVVVTVAARQDEAQSPAVQHLAIPTDRAALVRGLQKELARVGCFDGEVSGAWTISTRRAMQAFIDQVNATLPVEEPDAVLYALLQSEPKQVCGRPCPVGQGKSEDGRCVPDVVLAMAARQVSPQSSPVTPASPKTPDRSPASVVTKWKTATAAAVPSPTTLPSPPASRLEPPLAGRMALAGPGADPSAQDNRVPTVAAPARTRAARQKSRPRPRSEPRVVHGPRRAPLVRALFRGDWTL
jgi:hypothetical protein